MSAKNLSPRAVASPSVSPATSPPMRVAAAATTTNVRRLTGPNMF